MSISVISTISLKKTPANPKSTKGELGRREEKGKPTQRMTTAQLRLLRILGLQLIPNAIKQLHIALLRILLHRRNKRPAHRPRRLRRNRRIRTGLIILTPRPHDHIRRRRLGRNSPIVRLVARGRLLEEAHDVAGDAAHVAARVRGDDGEETLAGFFGEVGLFEDALRAVDVGQVEGGAGVAGVEDCGEADAGLEGGYHDAVHFVVDDVADLAEVDGVDDLVVAVGFVAVEVFGLASVTWCRGLVTCRISQGSRASGCVSQRPDLPE